MSPTPPSGPTGFAPLLEVRDLRVSFIDYRGEVKAVDGVSFDLDAGETLAIVGESGCGKSVTALAVMGLLPPRVGRIVGGTIRLSGRDLTALDERQWRAIRGNRIAMVFQEPMTSLNPVFTVGDQIAEVLLEHRRMSRSEARRSAIDLLRLVGIPQAELRIDAYPHHLSGGMRQRVMIAIAMACEPSVLLADEPTTALDVTIQAQVLALIRDLQDRFNMGVVLITHDLGVVAETADRAVVMYAGRVVERARVSDLFARPMHPYTRGLFGALPQVDLSAEAGHDRKPLQEIPGQVPLVLGLASGCAFNDRCSRAMPECRTRMPPSVACGPGHEAYCLALEQSA